MRRVLVLVLLTTILLPLATIVRAEEFHAGEVVVVTAVSEPIRFRPSKSSVGTNSVFAGELLTVLRDDPVRADGLVWWYVRTTTQDRQGWVPNTAIALATAAASSSATSSGCWSNDQVRTDDQGFDQWIEPPATIVDPESQYVATLTTTEGDIILELDAEHAPIATNNFICLANAGYYDGTDFHRTSADFLIQGGDATGTGTGGPGYTVPSDPTTGDYPAGSIALANSEPDQNGSQFFIAAADLTGKIPDDYPVFGHVVSGQDIVTEISQAPVEINPRGERSQPVEPVTIISVQISEQEDEVGPPLPTAASITDQLPTEVPTIEAAPTVALPPTEQTVIELDAKDIAFVPTEIEIDAADLPATIHMTNTGAALHNFSIDALNIDVDVNPGDTVDVVIPAGTAPGTYDFYCNVPGHKEAGMVGTLIITQSTAAVTANDSSSCAGVDAYISDYDWAVTDAFLSNPEAVRLFESDLESDEWLESMSSTELDQMERLFTDVAENVQSVTPPPIAREWQRLQIESLHLLAEFFSSARSVGVLLASIALDEDVTRLDRQLSVAIEDASGCPDFQIWATDESIFLDDLEIEATAFIRFGA